MYNSKNVLYIVSCIAAIEKINIYTSNITTPTALLEANNQMNFNATITLLVAIAEEIKKTENNYCKPNLQLNGKTLQVCAIYLLMITEA